MHFPAIDPVFFRLGPLQFRWYGLMYVIGFLASYFLIRNEARRRKLALDMSRCDLIFCLTGSGAVALGTYFSTTSGAFANRCDLCHRAGRDVLSWRRIGVAVAALWYARRFQLHYLQLADLAALAAPVGLGLGRIGNFINGELFGRTTTMPWGMIFPDGGPLPRHPSQLYEAFLEGIVLFFLVRLIARRYQAPGTAMAAFLCGYGLFRFVVELFRQPDSQLGLYFNFFSMGQLLSLPIYLAGGILLILLNRRKKDAAKEKETVKV